MIIVSTNSGKDEILKTLENETLKNIKFMTKVEFIHSFYFDYDEKTVYELCKKFSINSEIAKIYLENLYYIDNKKYDIEKLDKLVSIRNYLENNDLLKFDLLFKEYLKNNEVVFFNIEITKFDQIMIDEVKKITNVTVKNSKEKEYIPNIYEFNSKI